MRTLQALVWCAAALAGQSFTVGGLVVTPEPWNKTANLAKFETYARKAAAQGAQLILAPEGFLEGYVANRGRSPDLDRDKFFAVGEEIGGPLLERVRELARELAVHLSIGFAERRDGKMYNSAAIFSPSGALIARYSKSHTLDDEPFNTKGSELPVFTTPLGKWGLLICFDRQLPETARILSLKGAQILLVPAWGNYGEMNDIMMRVRAYENGVWLVFVHPKRCLVIDPRGRITAQNTGDQDQVVVAPVELPDKKPGPINYRRPELYSEITTK